MEEEQNSKPTTSKIAEELSSRTLKTERGDPELQFTLLDNIEGLFVVKGSPYENIKENANILREPELSPKSAIANYKNVMNARHDIWYDLIFKNKCSNWQTNGVESTFGSFIHKTLKKNIDNIPDENKRPDILFYDPDTNSVILGDITITTSVGASKSRKYEKYDPMAKFLSKMGYIVDHVDFVLREDLTNMTSQINLFKRKKIIKEDTDTKVHQDYTKCATDLMYAIKRMCNNLLEFNHYLDSDKKQDEGAKRRPNFSLLEGLLKKETTDLDLEPYCPFMSEVALVNIVKDEVERLGGSKYFDHSPEDVEAAFDSVINKNKDHKTMHPKSVLKVIDNSHTYNIQTGLELIEDFILDIGGSSPGLIKDYILDMLPSLKQIELMKLIRSKKMSRKEVKDDDEMKTWRVGGQFQYMRKTTGDNTITQHLEIKLNKGKRNPNTKKEPEIIDTDNIPYYSDFIESAIKYYGSPSQKPSFLDNSWDSYNKVEEDNTKIEREIYDYCRSTNGAQMTNSLSALFQRITHMSASNGTFDNIFIPPNGSFICIMPKNHSPVTKRSCDMPFIFLTRSVVGDPLSHIEFEYRHETDKMNYYVSKLSRLNLAKIACWENAGHRLVASSSYLISKCPALRGHKDKVVGLLTYLITDVHQKVSEYLDLLKYISFMPFADLHLLPKLVVDKCDLLMKTRLDAWMFKQIRGYIKELGQIDKLEARKPILQLHNGKVVTESLGIKLRLPSFFSLSTRHNDPTEFIEEIGMLFTSRPKHLYGSQFLDESTTMTAKWDVEYDDELIKFGGWASVGYDEKIKFPFNAKFCFSSDAIHYATQVLENNVDGTPAQLESHLFGGTYGDFMHTNCSLRGCTKEHKERQNRDDMHTTSIDACLRHYKDLNFVDKECRAISIGQSFSLSDKKMEFSMSEKDQRGGGRPIATPTLGTKAALMLIEKPEATIGTFMMNNILVAGKSKISEQHKIYTNAVSHGASSGFKEVYQLTEDQTKYSENDNPRKYEYYIRSSVLYKPEIRKLQMLSLRKLYDRRHLIHKYPIEIINTPMLVKKTFTDKYTQSVETKIGWPQGMLNNISTTVHSAADLWIAKAFKVAYPNIKLDAKGLVHSDDSWVTVCSNNLDDFKLFALFRMMAKKLFCLKINEKKLWGGKYLGEIVSNYNLNGKVHLATSKIISNGLSNLTYQNWPIDVSSQISTIQQAYRSGATIGTLILLATILRQQIMGAYQINGLQLELLHVLPIELGGYPKCSVFKLGVNGVNAMYDEIAEMYAQNQHATAHKITLAAAAVSRKGNNLFPPEFDIKKLEKEKEDYAEVIMPSRGEVFKGIRFLMPKSAKVRTALATINEITKPYESDGLGMIITKPLTLAESLGHLRDNTAGNMYRLAAEKYTQSVRRLAISQAQQSSGKVVKVNNGGASTLNEMYKALLSNDVIGVDELMVNEALLPESEMVWACSTIVNTATLMIDDHKKQGNVINRMPGFETIYDTISPLTDVLLHIIDESDIKNNLLVGNTLYSKYGTNKTCTGTLSTDAISIKRRFDKYFKFYEVRKACSIIMQNKINAMKERSWVQPKIYADSMAEFLEGLYGVTLNNDIRFKVHATREYSRSNKFDSNLITTLYSTEVINRMYDNKFVINTILGMNKYDALASIDQSKLDKNDSLKMAILSHEWNNNRDALDNLFESDRFVYRWDQTQNYGDKKKYSGDWKVSFMLGKLSGQIRSINMRTTIKVNKINMYLLLKAMRIIAERCFSKIYDYDTAWWLCPVWCATTPPMASKYYLKYISNFETIIDGTGSDKSISIELVPEFQIGELVCVIKPDRYIVDNVMRTVKVGFTNPQGEESIYRMGRVFQDLTMPLKNEVILEYARIQGFPCGLLYRNGIMEDLLLRRHISAAKRTIKRIIDSSGGENMMTPVWNVMYYLHGKMKRRAINIVEEVTMDTEDREIIDWEAETITVKEQHEYQETIEVEKLECTYLDYERVVVGKEKKIQKVPNIMKALCSQYWGDITEKNKLDFVYRLLHNPDIIRIRDEISSVEVDELNDYVKEYGHESQVSRLVYTFIVGTNLISPRVWLMINQRNMNRIKVDPGKFHGEDELVNEFCETINELFGLTKLQTPKSPIDFLEE